MVGRKPSKFFCSVTDAKVVSRSAAVICEGLTLDCDGLTPIIKREVNMGNHKFRDLQLSNLWGRGRYTFCKNLSQVCSEHLDWCAVKCTGVRCWFPGSLWGFCCSPEAVPLAVGGALGAK